MGILGKHLICNRTILLAKSFDLGKYNYPFSMKEEIDIFLVDFHSFVNQVNLYFSVFFSFIYLILKSIFYYFIITSNIFVAPDHVL